MKHIIQPIGDISDNPPKWHCDLDFQALCIQVDVTDPNGNAFGVTIEAQGGKLVLQCFDPTHDEPLRVQISAAGTIETDDERNGDQIIHHPTWTGQAPPP